MTDEFDDWAAAFLAENPGFGRTARLRWQTWLETWLERWVMAFAHAAVVTPFGIVHAPTIVF